MSESYDVRVQGEKAGWDDYMLAYVPTLVGSEQSHTVHWLSPDAQETRLYCIAPVIADSNKTPFERADYVLRVLGLTA